MLRFLRQLREASTRSPQHRRLVLPGKGCPAGHQARRHRQTEMRRGCARRALQRRDRHGSLIRQTARQSRISEQETAQAVQESAIRHGPKPPTPTLLSCFLQRGCEHSAALQVDRGTKVAAQRLDSSSPGPLRSPALHSQPGAARTPWWSRRGHRLRPRWDRKCLLPRRPRPAAVRPRCSAAADPSRFASPQARQAHRLRDPSRAAHPREHRSHAHRSVPLESRQLRPLPPRIPAPRSDPLRTRACR
mmetsp:Transcript_13542/g.50388  ORF Transcript_13542/g.50388 Transcript_13542/m.50388 type:complete len:247 (-) Transcript_13542:95-835(-)